MISDDLVRAHRGRALTPGAPVHARHGAESRHVLPGARNRQPVLLRRCRRSSTGGWRASPRLTGRHYHLFDYDGAADAEQVIVADGLGAPRPRGRPPRALNGRWAAQTAAFCKCASYRPFSAEHFLAALPDTCRCRRRARTHQGAGRARRAALSRCRHHPRASRRRRSAHDHAARDRRALWPVVEGFHARRWSRPFSTNWPSREPQERLHRRHHRRCFAHQP